MLERGQVRPVIYRTYDGLESLPQALEDLASRKIWGKAVNRPSFPADAAS